MSASLPDIEAVTTLLDEIAQSVIMPRFSRLSSEEIESKSTPGDPEDLVTVVDRQVEERLSAALRSLTPAVGVIGEEAVHGRPELLRSLASDQPLWVLDPIDGTKNFAAGRDGFGVMLAWVVQGCARAAWIVLPARREVFVAEAGGGTFRNGERIRVASSTEAFLRGSWLTRYMPDGLGPAVVEALRGQCRPLESLGCAAVDYASILKGEREFVVYYRLLPWDHAAPALILTEAGGCVEHMDGSAYSVRSNNQITVVARDQGVASQVRNWLRPRVVARTA